MSFYTSIELTYSLGRFQWFVREGCGNRYYEYFSISNDCSKILAERVSIEDFYSDGFYNILIRRSDIVIMNFDGTGEEVIELP